MSAPVTLILALVLVALTVFVIDQLRRGMHHLSKLKTAPGCFGSDPGPQSVAENDCFTCPFANQCVSELLRRAWWTDPELATAPNSIMFDIPWTEQVRPWGYKPTARLPEIAWATREGDPE
ncbi:hypothetical protein vBCbaSRXM_30 [Citromicrobium phage vB_CbaS-RXM]|nr:hypothetical protein vBCbaSRXM_30 [Citromicrobium phage vB_CbaS-RXM]